jgi:hypothetical protein
MATFWFVILVGVLAFVGGVVTDRLVFKKKK